METEALAPLFRICQDIPDGDFADSYFVWLCQYFSEVDEQGESFQRRELSLIPRKDLPKNVHEGPGCSIYPAPLIEEILKAVMLDENWDNISRPNTVGDWFSESMKLVHDVLTFPQNNDNRGAVVDHILANYLDLKRAPNYV